MKALATISAGLTVLSRSDGHESKGEAENTYGLPQGGGLAAELRKWFERQRKAVLDAVSRIRGGPESDELPDLSDWDRPMATAFVPFLSATWDDSGRRTMTRLGLDPDVFDVTNPHLKGRIEKASLAFCESTNRTTNKQLKTAVAKLRAELTAGLVDQGESIPELTRRVQAVFERATEGRARRIAATETTRAYHAAQEAAAEESGVVAGFELLLSGDACPLCRKVATEARRVKLGQAFAVIGSDPTYKEVRYPPLHPLCQCSMIEVLTPEYGGPERPDFRPTLDQPKPGPDYEPPEGLPEPKPEPGRQDTPVGTPRPAAAPPPPKPEPGPTPKPEPAPPEKAPQPAQKPPEKPIVPKPNLTPPRRPEPKGTPVGAALEVRVSSKVDRDVRHAIGAVDKVHGDGKLKRIPVTTDARMSAEGAYTRLVDNTPIGIRLKPTTDHIRTVLIHEIGHFLDRSAIPGTDAGGDRDWERDPLLSTWYHAVQATESVRRIKSLRSDPNVTKTVNGRPVRIPIGAKYVEYLLKPTEIWARAYTQYVALRSGDRELTGEIEAEMKGAVQDQWTPQDFEPVARAMDELFHKLGWRT